MIADHEKRPVGGLDALPSSNPGSGKDHRRRPGERVINEKAPHANRPALRPARIHKFLRGPCRRGQKLLEVADRLRFREALLAQIHLVPVFKSAHQLDAIH